jgi:hypothetical protein
MSVSQKNVSVSGENPEIFRILRWRIRPVYRAYLGLFGGPISVQTGGGRTNTEKPWVFPRSSSRPDPHLNEKKACFPARAYVVDSRFHVGGDCASRGTDPPVRWPGLPVVAEGTPGSRGPQQVRLKISAAFTSTKREHVMPEK